MRRKKELIKRNIVSCYKEYFGDNLVSIVLFGSRARNNAKRSSDYDLFIIANTLPKSPLKRMMVIREPIRGKFQERISIIAKTKKEFNENVPPLYLDLSVDGQILYDRNFVRDKLQKIRDIIQKVGLRRVSTVHGIHWKWIKEPKKAWILDWGGYREF